MKAPNNTANSTGTRPSIVCCGSCNDAAAFPIPDVVYMYWKEMSLELKQLSRVTSCSSGSLSSANSMSTH